MIFYNFKRKWGDSMKRGLLLLGVICLIFFFGTVDLSVYADEISKISILHPNADPGDCCY